MRIIDDNGLAVDFDPSGLLSNDAVTNAYLANMPDQRIKGNVSGSTGDPQDLTQAQVRVFLGLAALAYLATIGTAQITDDAVTFPKLVNISGPGKVVGRKTTSSGAGDAEELVGSDVRSMLGTLDADTVNGQSASAIATSAANTIRNGVGPAYDTLIEIYNQLVTDETAVAGIITTLGAKNKLGVAADLGTSSADAPHVHNFGTYDVIPQLQRKADHHPIPAVYTLTDVNTVTWNLPEPPTTGQYRSLVIPMVA